MYTGGAEVSLSRTCAPNAAIDTAVRNAQNRLQRYADQFKWWPVLKLQVTYTF